MLAARAVDVAVDEDVAPFFNEMLSRLDGIIDRSPGQHIAPPPGLHDPQSRLRFLAHAQLSLADLATRQDDETLAAAAAIVREHVALTTELAMRKGV